MKRFTRDWARISAVTIGVQLALSSLICVTTLDMTYEYWCYDPAHTAYGGYLSFPLYSIGIAGEGYERMLLLRSLHPGSPITQSVDLGTFFVASIFASLYIVALACTLYVVHVWINVSRLLVIPALVALLILYLVSVAINMLLSVAFNVTTI